MTVRNLFLSLILSVALTFVVTVLYTFYPIISLVVGGFFRSVFLRQTDVHGIAAVAGGMSSLWIVFAIAPASFLIIFSLLQRRNRR